jgi:predicted AAA+ superfamily ATPase
MKRYAIEKLVEWKNKENRKPLVLKGARQVGKTWLMKEFGRLHYKKVAYISFYNNKSMKKVFDDDYEVNRIISSIGIESKIEVTPNDTLIILDEIQEAPRALESLKCFCENAPEYHIIAAGSLLGVAIHSGISFPVGNIDIINLNPMNFREFLEAMGENQLADLLLKDDFSLICNFSSKYIYWLKNYYYVGGMPRVVDYFSKHKNYEVVRKLQNDILEQYEDDFGKHIKETNLARLRLVWNSIPVQLAKENKKFFFGQIKKGSRLKDYEIAIEWLLDCCLIKKVYKVKEPRVPLKAYVDFSSFKLFVLDIGLLGAMSELDAKSILDGNEVFVEFKGAMAEQYVLQELVSENKYSLYYYGTNTATFEMDFMIQKERNIVPIEVKAETNLQSKSLKVYCDKYKPQIAYRFSMKDYEKQSWMTNIPLYAVCKI